LDITTSHALEKASWTKRECDALVSRRSLMVDTDFVPRWASAPGDTIKAALDEQRLDRHSLAEALALSDEELDALLQGDIPLTIRLAEHLSSTIGGSIEFWMTRDGQYRADRSRVVADAWAQRMPIGDMATFGWIASDVDDWVGQIEVCLRFFDVETPEVWETDREALAERTRFRSSRALDADEFAVAAWLRQCEIELSQIPCRAWDTDAFARLLPELLPLTRVRDPRLFLAELRTRCAEVGVAVGVVRAPRGCPVSGAALQLANGQPGIALSGRHRADDHLWFTFFHEAAHLLLHGTDALYLDEIEPDSDPPPSADEVEADNFAGTLLVPPEYDDRLFQARRSPLELRRIASEIGVSLGIVVGQLQHRGAIGYNTRLNRLKTRYTWNGPSLEKT
jgi:HTH-type transcriptional regulator / antitoxin HigA